ncbi:hypothetical protein pb186bvf_012290 [Paramecium bursaria]
MLNYKLRNIIYEMYEINYLTSLMGNYLYQNFRISYIQLFWYF